MKPITKKLIIISTLILLVVAFSLTIGYSKSKNDGVNLSYYSEYYSFYGKFTDKKSKKKYIEFHAKRNKGEDYLYSGLDLNPNNWDIIKFEVYNNIGKVWRLNPYTDKIIIIDKDDNIYESINLSLRSNKELRKKIFESQFKDKFLISYKDKMVDHRTFYSVNFLFKGMLPKYEQIKKIIYRRTLSPEKKYEKQQKQKYVKQSKSKYSTYYANKNYASKEKVKPVKGSTGYLDIGEEIEVYTPQYKDYVLSTDSFSHNETYKGTAEN